MSDAPLLGQSVSSANSRYGHVPALYDCGVDGDGMAGSGEDTKLDAIFVYPHSGYDEDVRMRLFPIDGRAFDVFIKADRLRQALATVEAQDA